MPKTDFSLGAESDVFVRVPKAMRPLFLAAGCGPQCQLAVSAPQKDAWRIYHEDILVYTIPWSDIMPPEGEQHPEGHNPWAAAAEAAGAVHR